MLCQRINEKNKKIFYDPLSIVYHHRRRMMGPHLKQVFNYGLNRGLFVKKFGGNSLKLTYFVPSLFFLFIVSGITLSFFNQTTALFFVIFLSLYFIYTSILGLKIRSLKEYLYYIFGTFITQMAYGYGFLKGLLK